MLQLRLCIPFLFLKFVLIIWILEMVNNDFKVIFNNSFRLDKVTHLHKVHAHVLTSLQELFLLLSEEFRSDSRLSLVILQCRSPTQLMLNVDLLFFV